MSDVPTVSDCIRLLESEATAKECDAQQSERRGFLNSANADRREARIIREAVKLLFIHALPEETQ